MGMEQRVLLGERPALWPAVAELLKGHNYPAQLRMIDGELAFPDEAPPEGWRELRLSTAAGMVTLRREGGEVILVVWGNADEALRTAVRTQESAPKDISALHEEMEQIDVPVYQEIPERRRDRLRPAAEEIAAQEQQDQ